MSLSLELQKKALIEALGLDESDIFEARHNLVGTFGTLHKIRERLIKEGKLKVVNEEVVYD